LSNSARTALVFRSPGIPPRSGRPWPAGQLDDLRQVLLVRERAFLALRDQRVQQLGHLLVVLGVDRRLVDDELADVVLDGLGDRLLLLADGRRQRVDGPAPRSTMSWTSDRSSNSETFTESSARMYVSMRCRIAGSYSFRSIASPLCSFTWLRRFS
jgi:hypothetical protein